MNKTDKRKMFLNVTVLTLALALAFFYLSKSDIVGIKSLSSITLYNFIVAFSYLILSFLLIALIDYFIYKTETPDITFGVCLVNQLMGNLGSNITPYKSAHFPMMVYYQIGVGIPPKTTATALVKCQVVYSLSSIIVYLGLMIFLGAKGYTVNFNQRQISLWLIVFVGFNFHFWVFIGIVILSFVSPLQDKILSTYAKIFSKLKKGKTFWDIKNEAVLHFEIYKKQIKEVFKKPSKYILPFVLYAIYMPIVATNEYVSYLLVSGEAFGFGMFFTFYMLSLTSAYAVGIVPVPGGVGTHEILFTLVFSAVVRSEIMGSVLLLYRTVTFYVMIVIEIIILAVITVKGKKGTFRTYA